MEQMESWYQLLIGLARGVSVGMALALPYSCKYNSLLSLFVCLLSPTLSPTLPSSLPSGWLSPEDDPLGYVGRIDQRIEDTTGLDMSTAEQLQVSEGRHRLLVSSIGQWSVG